jgi:NAD(P)-dependent dehydrogenase (short-subunit alcohol dehydrogenase family)
VNTANRACTVVERIAGDSTFRAMLARIREQTPPHGGEGVVSADGLWGSFAPVLAGTAATTLNRLVNNAGAPMRRTDRQILWPDSDWVGDINLKLVGMLRVVQAFLPNVARDGSGRIINISGTGGSLVWAPALTIGLNNAAMNQVTTYLAQDLAGDRITVNALIPGLVGTEGREAWAENMARQQNTTKEEFIAGFCKRMGILAGRWADMSEIADMAVFLASDRAKYINGSRITVDGGMTINPRPA